MDVDVGWELITIGVVSVVWRAAEAAKEKGDEYELDENLRVIRTRKSETGDDVNRTGII